MYFKKQKTSNDFLFFNEIGLDFVKNIWKFKESIKEETIRKIDNWEDCWEKIIQDPILFWYLMVIFEVYKDRTGSSELLLSKLVKTSKYVDLIEKLDDELFDELSGGNFEFYRGCSYSMLLVRIIGLTGAFFAFDIRNISLVDHVNNIAQKILKETIVDAREKMPSDSSLNSIIATLKELSSFDDDPDSKFIKIYNERAEQPNKLFIGDKNFYDLYPFENEEGYFEGIFDKLAFLGECVKIRFDFDMENMGKLELLSVNIVSSFLVNLNSLTHKFIKMAKKWKRTENTLYIPFETLFTDFPLIQFLYHLQKNGGCGIASWLIDDNWVVAIYDGTIADALGMGDDETKDELKSKRVTFDYEAEILNIDNEPLSLGDKNDVFMRMFFDLEKNGAVSIDELSESIDGALESMGKEARHKAEKSLVYDRLPRLNKKILRETGVEEFFFIRNRKVELADIDLLARSSKNPRKKTKNLEA